MFQISTAPEPESNEFAQSTSRSNFKVETFTRKSETSSTSSTPYNKDIVNYKSPKTDESKKSKKAKFIQRERKKKRHSKTKSESNISIPNNESINIDVNIQDVTLKRTLTKKNFFKRKKIKC